MLVFLPRGVVPGGAGGAMAPPYFGRSVKPSYLTQGGQSIPMYYEILAPQNFQNFLWPIFSKYNAHGKATDY